MPIALPNLKRFKCREEEGVLVLTFGDRFMSRKEVYEEVAAEIDSFTKGLANCGCSQVIFDFSIVEFMPSDVLGPLIKLEKQCKRSSIGLRFVAIRSEIYEVFAITRLNMLFMIHETLQKALEACRAA